MAKNLQSVLNSVVNDLLQESTHWAYDPRSINTTEKLFATVNDQARPIDPDKIAQSGAEVAAKMKDIEAARNFVDTHDYSVGAIPHNTQHSAEEVQRALDAQRTFGDRIQDAYWDARDWAGDKYDAIAKSMADHPYYWGAGGLGAALAAGAGALYLRKRQREANRGA